MKRLLLILSVSCGFAFADILTASETGAVITWPAASPASLSIGRREIVFDGVPATITEFAGVGVRITSDSTGDWVSTGERLPRYSFVLRSIADRDVSLAFSIYPRKEFLPDLETSTWGAYVAGVRARYGPALVSLNEGRGGFYFFGGPYREVIYTYRESPDAPPRTRREIFGLVGERLIVATIEGAADTLPRLKVVTDQFLARLNLEE